VTVAHTAVQDTGVPCPYEMRLMATFVSAQIIKGDGLDDLEAVVP